MFAFVASYTTASLRITTLRSRDTQNADYGGRPSQKQASVQSYSAGTESVRADPESAKAVPSRLMVASPHEQVLTSSPTVPVRVSEGFPTSLLR